MLTDVDLETSRKSREYLAAMRCECGPKCAVEECTSCGRYQPECRTAVQMGSEGEVLRRQCLKGCRK